MTVNIRPSIKTAGAHAAIDRRMSWGEFVEAAIEAFIPENGNPQTGAAEKLLAILDRNAEGLVPEDGKKKWDAIRKTLAQGARRRDAAGKKK